MGVGPVYPVFLNVTGRDCLVVGAGTIAERKIQDLVEAGATVRVVAPHATAQVQRWAQEGRLRWQGRPFEDADLEGAWFVVSATGDAAVQGRIFSLAQERRCFVLAIDDLAHGSAYSGSVVRRTPFLVTIFSFGEAPALSRLLREMLDEFLPSEDWVRHARALRARWRSEGTPMGDRFAQLVREFKGASLAGATATRDAA